VKTKAKFDVLAVLAILAILVTAAASGVPAAWGADPAAGPGDEGTSGRDRIAVGARLGRRLGDAASAIPPGNGVGVVGTIELDYLHLGKSFAAALGVDFGYDRFATSEVGMVTVNGNVQTFGSTRVISETTFVLVHTAAVRVGRLRPYVSLGAGVGLGYFDSVAPTFSPGTARDTHLLGRAGLGLDVTVTDLWCLNVRADYTAVRGPSSLRTDDGRALPVFGDLLDLGAGIAYRF
jgi:hypothetical protein